jgi:hypothetical protein
MVTMRERVARCCPNVQELMNGFMDEAEECFGINRRVETFDSKTGEMKVHGRFHSAKQILDKARKDEKSYQNRMTAAILKQNAEMKKFSRLDAYADQDLENGIDYGDVDEELVLDRYVEFASVLAGLGMEGLEL